MRMKKVIVIGLLALIVMSCESNKRGVVEDVVTYNTAIDDWHAKRIEELKGPSGWLNLAGLFWLNEGINTVGASPTNSIVFPEGKAPGQLGYFLLKDGKVLFETGPGITVTANAKPVSRLFAFQPDSVPPKLRLGSLEWFIIKRDTRYGIRLRDFESLALRDFTGIERYPIDVKVHLDATFEPAVGRTIPITNVLGQTTDQPSPGTLIFELDGKEVRLDVIDEGGEDYFVIFGDATNAKETYGAGRYLYVNKPDADGHTIIDFNKAYNPPCAFTAFATCPLPPKQNILEFAIRAGEKNFSHH